MERYLEPEYDSRKSFYKKAYVRTVGDYLILTSYSTDVAKINLNTRIPEVKGFYSQTTTRHIKEFIYQFTPLGYLSTKEIKDKYTEYGRKELAEKEALKAKKKAEREELRKKAQEAKELKNQIFRETREARKAQLLKELTEELGGCMSKSEIRKLVYQELNQEF